MCYQARYEKSLKNISDGKVKKKFQSSWDLTPKEIAKNEKRLKKKKGKQPRTSVILSKGLKELMNLADPLMTKEQTTLGEPTLKNLAEMKEESSEIDDMKGLEIDKEPLGLVNGGYHRSGKIILHKKKICILLSIFVVASIHYYHITSISGGKFSRRRGQ